MDNAKSNKTETGISIDNYIAERDAGTVALSKPARASQNYVYMRTTYTLALVDGVVTAVEGLPELRNINRQSLADLHVTLDRQEGAIAAAREQLAALEADMDKLDAA